MHLKCKFLGQKLWFSQSYEAPGVERINNQGALKLELDRISVISTYIDIL